MTHGRKPHLFRWRKSSKRTSTWRMSSPSTSLASSTQRKREAPYLRRNPRRWTLSQRFRLCFLGQAPASSAQHRVLGPDGQRREALRARDLQPGTLPYRAAHATTQPGTYRTTEPAQDIRNLLPPGLDALEEGAFQFLDWFHGAPFALYSKVGHDAGLPPVHNLGGLYPLRPRRERSLPSALRRRNFSIHGYCLLSCQAHCGWACSRPVSTDARQLHDHHFCQVCHR